MNQTPFYHIHRTLGARMVDFAGWQMPIQYTGILAEHAAVRNAAGIFDISHMGQFWIQGAGALDFLQKVLTNDLRLAKPGKGIYGHVCKPTGGIIDDVFVYCLEPNLYLMIVNASRRAADLQWLEEHRPPNAELMEAPQAAAFALQGPQSPKLLQKLLGGSVPLEPRGVADLEFKGTSAVVARTGYTGEDGFEFFGPAGHILPLWDQLLEIGRPEGLLPCGLGARDTLRLEMGYMLYGHDIDEEHTPLEAGLEWVVKFEKGDFIGREALLQQKKEGLKKRLCGIRLLEPGVPRAGAPVTAQGKPLGVLSSGTYAPSLKTGIGLAYLPVDTASEGASLEVSLGPRQVKAVTQKPPFYKKPQEVARATTQ